jgi:hypothetical protein
MDLDATIFASSLLAVIPMFSQHILIFFQYSPESL